MVSPDPSSCISLGEGRLTLQSQRLEGMAGGMSQVQGTPGAMILAVGVHEFLFYGHRLFQKMQQRVGIIISDIVGQHLLSQLRRVDKGVLEHLGISREEFL